MYVNSSVAGYRPLLCVQRVSTFAPRFDASTEAAVHIRGDFGGQSTCGYPSYRSPEKILLPGNYRPALRPLPLKLSPPCRMLHDDEIISDWRDPSTANFSD